jgi:hypothetical protein
MRNQTSKLPAHWRRRREQYLRASGRHLDLIKEGYERAESSSDWMVVIGRRKTNPRESFLRPNLSLVAKQTRVDIESAGAADAASRGR